MDIKRNKEMTLSYEEKENYSKIKDFPTLEDQQNYGINHPNTEFIHRCSQYVEGEVLEVGCSYGYLLYTLYLMEKGLGLSGLDINQDEIDKGAVFLSRSGVPATLMKGNILQDPLTEYYDTILLFHILEHTYQDDVNRLIEVVGDHLVMGGKVLVHMPYGENYTCKQHVNDFNCIKLINLMERHGFRTIDCYREQREHGQRNGPCDYLCGVYER